MNVIFKEPWQKDVGQKALDTCLEETYSKWLAPISFRSYYVTDTRLLVRGVVTVHVFRDVFS